MTKYEYFIKKADECDKKARNEKNYAMIAFYKNAAEGFRIKAAKLTVKEAGEMV